MTKQTATKEFATREEFEVWEVNSLVKTILSCSVSSDGSIFVQYCYWTP